MGKLAVQFLDQGLHRALFDAMPLPVFVVDEGFNVLEHNAAAAHLFKQRKRTRKPRRAGDVLDCLHATESPNGCGGATACSDCGMREVVRTAFKGRSARRRQAEMQLIQKGKPAKVNLRISCRPFTHENKSFVLLVLEGLNS